MIQNFMIDDLYYEGEEKFNGCTAHAYRLVVLVPQLRKFYRFVINDLAHLKFARILDIGAGTGYVLTLLAKRDLTREYVGIDPSPTMVNIANKYAKKQGVSAVTRFMLGSSRVLPQNIKFDIIYSTLSFHHWAEKDIALLKILNSLTPNGEFRVYEFNMSNNGHIYNYLKAHLMSKEDFKILADKTGATLKQIIEHDTYIIGIFKVPA